MPRIPKSEIERIKRETDLVALVQSRGIKLEKHGSKDLRGLCPFHGDKETANFIVTPGNGLFHCMACGKGGDVIRFVEQHDGVSFRHAFELLDKGGVAAFAARPLTKQATVPVLPCPLDAEAKDAVLVAQVAGYYQERLRQSAPALEYLSSRGLSDTGLIEQYQLGYADRTLGLRMPDKNRKEGQTLRSRLMQLGMWRESGHEHFNGCVVVPLHNESGEVVSFYGRRIGKGTVEHLYSPGPHRGLFNRVAFESEEIILCEAVLDALTFCAQGITNVSTLYGTEGFTEELAGALGKVRRVKLAYDADQAGERAAVRDTERLQALGMEVWRVKFPWGMDANEYARKVTPAGKSLSLLLNAAAWQGRGQGSALHPCTDTSYPPGKEAVVNGVLAVGGASVTANKAATTKVQAVSEPCIEAALAPSSSLAASVSCSQEEAAKEKSSGEQHEKAAAPVDVPSVSPTGVSVAACLLEQRGEGCFLTLENREYRVSGLEKTLGADHLKVGLRVQSISPCGSPRFHLDQVDLMRDTERRRFIERAAEETGLSTDLFKRDMGRLLLAVETAQSAMLKPSEAVAPAVELSAEERQAALEWLRKPNLIGRLREAFHLSGIVGEDTNTLIAYLSGVSRKLERPLAIIIQSASAAGKTTLMDAVLSLFPEEDRIKYSAMTGQSLYYLGETNLKHKILAIVEEAGAEKASYALKLLQSEGELVIASTGKDPTTGRMVTQEYRVEGPVMIILTTTAIDIDEEFQNRCFILTVNESREQTERIHQWQRQRRTLAGLIAAEERKEVLVQLRNAQRLLAPVKILNPYAPDLTFTSERTRTRRDHEKYLTLIDAITLLHQHQRQRGEHLVKGRLIEYVEVSLEDIELANQLAPEVLARSLDELPPQTRRLLGYIRELVKSKRENQSAKTASSFSRREIKQLCGWSLTQVSVHLQRLVELEYLALRCSRMGGPFVYELLIDVDAPEVTVHIKLIDVTTLKKHLYDGKVTGFNPQVSGGDAPPPVTLNPLNGNGIASGYRGNGNAHQGATARAVVS